MTIKGDAKFKVKLTHVLENDISNLVNFHASNRKSGKLHFYGLLLSKAYNVLVEKVQKNYVSWHWRVMQSLKENRVLVLRMTWRIWWILMRVVVNLKILIFNFCQLQIKFQLKKYIIIISRDTPWRKTEFLFKKWL